MNLGDFPSASAARSPQKTAIVFDNERISCEQLEQSTVSKCALVIRRARMRQTVRPAKSLSGVRLRLRKLAAKYNYWMASQRGERSFRSDWFLASCQSSWPSHNASAAKLASPERCD
jgi:hypothetical protein